MGERFSGLRTHAIRQVEHVPPQPQTVPIATDFQRTSSTVRRRRPYARLPSSGRRSWATRLRSELAKTPGQRLRVAVPPMSRTRAALRETRRGPVRRARRRLVARCGAHHAERRSAGGFARWTVTAMSGAETCTDSKTAHVAPRFATGAPTRPRGRRRGREAVPVSCEAKRRTVRVHDELNQPVDDDVLLDAGTCRDVPAAAEKSPSESFMSSPCHDRDLLAASARGVLKRARDARGAFSVMP